MTEPGGAIGSFLLLGADDEVTYNWFHNGQGVESTTEANAEGWRQVRDGYDEVLFLVRRGLAESKASWTGVAADGANGAMSPLQAWVEETVDAAARASATVSAQSNDFSATKARLSPPVAVPDKPWWNDVWPGETNYDRALEAKQANSIHNLDLVKSYGDSTQANTTGYPDFGEPVVVATGVAPRPEQPGRPPNPGIAEWPTVPPRRPGPGGESPPTGGPSPSPEPGPSIVSSPAPAEPEPSGPPNQSDTTVSSGHAPVVESPLPPWQDVPGGRNPGSGGGPVPGLVGPPGAPDESGSGGRAQGGRPGEPGPGGRNGGGPGAGRPDAGGRAGGGSPGGVLEREAVAGRGVAGVRGGAGSPGGMVPAGARSASAEDDEHRNKFGPVDWHEDFWDDNPPLAPPVIGVDAEEQ